MRDALLFFDCNGSWSRVQAGLDLLAGIS